MDATLERAGFRPRTPTATTRPQQSGSRGTTLSFIDALACSNLLSDFPSFSNGSHPPPNTHAFSRPRCTPIVASTIPLRTNPNHVARNQHKPPSRLVTPCILNITLSTICTPFNHSKFIVSCLATTSTIPVDRRRWRERHSWDYYQKTRQDNRAPKRLLGGLLCP